jgi:hypothetical protein
MSLTVKFLSMTPLETPLYFEASITREVGRKCLVSGSVQSLDRAVVYATGEGTWIESKKIDTINRLSHL